MIGCFAFCTVPIWLVFGWFVVFALLRGVLGGSLGVRGVPKVQIGQSKAKYHLSVSRGLARGHPILPELFHAAIAGVVALAN